MATGGQNFVTRYTYECFYNNLDPVHRIQTKFSMDILLDPRNKLVEEFFLKSKMAAGGQKLNFDIISAQNSPFGLANGSLSSDLDKIWQADTTQP